MLCGLTFCGLEARAVVALREGQSVAEMALVRRNASRFMLSIALTGHAARAIVPACGWLADILPDDVIVAVRVIGKNARLCEYASLTARALRVTLA